MQTILDEVRDLSQRGFKEVTLLGQNVNNYADETTVSERSFPALAPGFSTVAKPFSRGVSFTELLDKVSLVDPEMRIRFTSPHPKNYPQELIDLMAERGNICKLVHVPAQSGSDTVLARMWRG